jgi:cytoskeletal protein CcmA (bactofilin family)
MKETQMNTAAEKVTALTNTPSSGAASLLQIETRPTNFGQNGTGGQRVPSATSAPSLFAAKELEISPASEKLTINLERELISSVISKSSQMQGNIKSSEGYRIDGQLQGDLTSDTTVLVSEGALVVGKITAARIVVQGTVEGGIECAGQLILARTAVVSGEILYKDIVTYQGSTVEGSMRRIDR